MNEEELIRRAQAGDKQALSDLIAMYYPAVERFAYQMGNTADEVQDITQEVFIKVFRFIHQFSHAKFSTWLYKITLNTSKDYSRKKSSYLKKLLRLQKERPSEVLNSEQFTLKGEEEKCLHECIQQLDDKYKIPIILFYFHDKKYEEIAEILGLNLSTVKVRILRAKEALKKRLQQYGEKEGEQKWMTKY
ncbi:sigma-70 family RNA polymerase sigma factor [Peribacillus saganii]|uniref:RNA polymerase sigma factor n=1 Tax=Peribacillus saganii TaxID=2303992 RepID=A0A372LR08_9BACI|nr:sigma-70 family RNA polymerase sigma factor [Peribacillus saganii]RFU70171.1 sigma-70 family RNA polymerase sigma factor [Peribacillus saganii]